MVYEHVEGFTLDSVLKNHVFNEEETKYVVAVVVQILEYFHEQNVALTELAPDHFVVEKKTGQIKVIVLLSHSCCKSSTRWPSTKSTHTQASQTHQCIPLLRSLPKTRSWPSLTTTL
jgi:hypothetical protein